MKVLVACESSGTVRSAFLNLGHDDWSCDLLPADDSSEHHIQGDCMTVLGHNWDLVIAHPPCTHLSSSGARWWKDKGHLQPDAIAFFLAFTSLPCAWAIENPVGIMSGKYRKPDQIIQPWQFGHGEVKTTCLWLNKLPKLRPTNIVAGRDQKCWKTPPSKDRWKIRSKTYSGIAQAMAQQWQPEPHPPKDDQ